MDSYGEQLSRFLIERKPPPAQLCRETAIRVTHALQSPGWTFHGHVNHVAGRYRAALMPRVAGVQHETLVK